MKTLNDIKHFAGTSEGNLDALEANLGTMVFRPAARTARDKWKEATQVRKENGETTLMKWLCVVQYENSIVQ